MTYAITQTCCTDAACVAVCPVNCIRPTPQERAFGSTEMLHVDPRTCIDCGACADACPVDAIYPVAELPAPLSAYAGINAAYFDGSPVPAPAAGSPNFHAWDRPVFDRVLPAGFRPLRVAVVGTGPAGMYTAEDLLLHTDSEVTLIDRLPVAGGLVRYGVAPDHPATRRAQDTFARLYTHPRVRMFLGLRAGEHLTAEELAAHHDAVVYAVGASGERRLGVPGEDLPGSVSAGTLVSWYNAHPDVAPGPVGAAVAGAGRVVVVGTGNVALDVARVLVADPAELAATDIADHALAALGAGPGREVVLLGRRGPEDAACTRSELLALTRLPGVEVVLDDHDPRTGRAVDAAGPGGLAALLRGLPRVRADRSGPPAPGRRIVLRFHSELLGGGAGEEWDERRDGSGAAEAGAGRVRGVRVTGADGERVLAAGAVVRAIGHRGTALPGLPFDEATGTVPHEGGRVTGRPGTYVVGWIKRGPSGGIGANRACAAETVGTLLADAVAGALRAPDRSARAFARLARRRSPGVVDARGMAAIDRAELARGRSAGRPRGRLATTAELLAAARRRLPPA
jgi:ferredoxin/flavodoxin---NADP+ reductase